MVVKRRFSQGKTGASTTPTHITPVVSRGSYRAGQPQANFSLPRGYRITGIRSTKLSMLPESTYLPGGTTMKSRSRSKGHIDLDVGGGTKLVARATQKISRRLNGSSLYYLTIEPSLFLDVESDVGRPVSVLRKPTRYPLTAPPYLPTSKSGRRKKRAHGATLSRTGSRR